MSFGVSLRSQLPASVTKRIYFAALFARPVLSASWRRQYAMRQKLFSLSRSQREDMWRRFKQADDRRVAERLHAILLLDSGQNADAVSSILHIHPKTLKRWIKAFATGGEDALTSFKYVGGDGWLTDEQQQQFTTWLDADVRSTAEAISWVEEQFALSYSDSGMRKLVGRLDYRYEQLAKLPYPQ